MIKLNSISSFWKSVGVLVLGTGGAQVINLLCYPILSRLFNPDQFGVLATFMSVVSIFTVIATGQYEKSIVISNSNKEAINVISLVLLFLVGASIVYWFLLYILQGVIFVHIENVLLRRWLWLVPIVGINISIYNCFNEWCVKNRLFRKLSANKLWNAVHVSGLKVILGVFQFSSLGLLYGELGGRFFSAVGAMNRFFRHKRSLVFLSSISLKSIFSVHLKHFDFPKLMLPAVLLDSFVLQLPILFITFYFGSTSCGHFSMALMLLSVPSTVVGVAIGDVFRQTAIQEYRRYGAFDSFVRTTLKKLLLFTIPLLLFSMFFIPFFIPFFLGEEWYLSGVYAALVLPYTACNFLNNVVNSVFVITQRFKEWLWIRIFTLFSFVLGLFLGGAYFKDMFVTVILYSLLGIISNIVIIFLSVKYSK